MGTWVELIHLRDVIKLWNLAVLETKLVFMIPKVLQTTDYRQTVNHSHPDHPCTIEFPRIMQYKQV